MKVNCEHPMNCNQLENTTDSNRKYKIKIQYCSPTLAFHQYDDCKTPILCAFALINNAGSAKLFYEDILIL